MEKVDLILVCHNHLRFTQIAVESILADRTYPFRLIVVDNASSDGTKEWLSSLDITYLRLEENKGWVGAVNRGLEEARSGYVAFLNNDIRVSSEWLKKLMAHMRPGVAAVGPVSNYVMGRQHISYNDGSYEEEANFLIFFCVLINRRALQKVGGFLEPTFFNGGDDIDLSIRFKEARYKLLIARDTFVEHFHSQTFRHLPGGHQYQIDAGMSDMVKKWGQEKIQKNMELWPTILAGIPNVGFHYPEFFTAYTHLDLPAGCEMAESYRTPIHLARNAFAQLAIDLHAKYLLFLDADMVPPSYLVKRLLFHQKDIVGGLAFKRRAPFEPCILKQVKKDFYEHLLWVKRGLVQVDGIGMSGTLIKTDVFKKLEPPWFLHTPELAEDLFFCQKATEAGFAVWADTDLILGHIGPSMVIDEETHANYLLALTEKPGGQHD